MERLLGRFAEIFYALMRFVVGALFACHGAQKLFHVFGGPHVAFDLHHSKMLIAALIELLGGALVAIGLFTSCAAFVASGEMAVAYWTVHASGGFWPIENKGELAVLYCFVFLYIAARGAGRFRVARSKGGR